MFDGGQFYFDETRENEPHALPDGEVFYRSENDSDYWSDAEEDVIHGGAGWYWWSCFPGCLPDSDPSGPFETAQLALDDARAYMPI
jgi:hypothetical protein